MLRFLGASRNAAIVICLCISFPVFAQTTQPSITITSPSGGEQFTTGQTVQVNFNYANLQGTSVDVYLRQDPKIALGYIYLKKSQVHVTGSSSASFTLENSLADGTYEVDICSDATQDPNRPIGNGTCSSDVMFTVVHSSNQSLGVTSSGESCAPYICADGTQVPRCSDNGTVINYFAAPCLTHGGEVQPATGFSDVSSDNPYVDAINYLQTKGVVQGYADGTFRPNTTINRAEFTKIIIGAAPYNGAEALPNLAHYASCDFSDVDPNAWYCGYIMEAHQAKFIAGYPDGTFHPAATINFAEAAKILVTAFQIPQTQTSTWYEGYVRALASRNAIPTTIQSFDQPITRGEMAGMIYRLDANVTNRPSMTYEELVAANISTATQAAGTVTFTDPLNIYSLTYPSSWLDEMGNAIGSVDGEAAFSVPSIDMKFVGASVSSSVMNSCPNIQPSPGTIVQSVQFGGRNFTAVETIENDIFDSSTDTITFTSQLSPTRCLVLKKIISTAVSLEKSSQDQLTAKQEQSQMQDALKTVIKSVQILAGATQSGVAGWQTYSGNGYSLLYPSDWSVQNNVTFSSVDSYDDSFIAQNQTGILFTPPTPSTNLQGAESHDVSVFVTILPMCPNLPSTLQADETGGSTTTINGRSFMTDYTNDGAAGSLGEYWYYASQINPSQCILIREFYFHSSGDADPDPAIAHHEIAVEYSKLNQIVQSINVQ